MILMYLFVKAGAYQWLERANPVETREIAPTVTLTPAGSQAKRKIGDVRQECVEMYSIQV
jgi:hypothetical protein